MLECWKRGAVALLHYSNIPSLHSQKERRASGRQGAVSDKCTACSFHETSSRSRLNRPVLGPIHAMYQQVAHAGDRSMRAESLLSGFPRGGSSRLEVRGSSFGVRGSRFDVRCSMFLT